MPFFVIAQPGFQAYFLPKHFLNLDTWFFQRVHESDFNCPINKDI